MSGGHPGHDYFYTEPEVPDPTQLEEDVLDVLERHGVGTKICDGIIGMVAMWEAVDNLRKDLEDRDRDDNR